MSLLLAAGVACGGQLPFEGPGTYRWSSGGVRVDVAIPAPDGHPDVARVEAFRDKLGRKQRPTYVLATVTNEDDAAAQLPTVAFEFEDGEAEVLEPASAAVLGWSTVLVTDEVKAEGRKLHDALAPKPAPPGATSEVLLVYDAKLPQFAYVRVGDGAEERRAERVKT